MIARLMREHEELRKLGVELEAILGAPVGSGWDDCSHCDVERLKAAQAKLSKDLLAHEEREKKALTDALTKEGGDPAAFGRELEKSQQTLAHLIGMMKTVSTLYDGRHAYALRGAVRRVHEALQEHLSREERMLFPLLHRAHQHHHPHRA